MSRSQLEDGAAYRPRRPRHSRRRTPESSVELEPGRPVQDPERPASDIAAYLRRHHTRSNIEMVSG